jgi:hypothetical protein
MPIKLNTYLYALSLVLGIVLIWIAPHSPLTDLPQHAAQVALLKDILLGQSKWHTFFNINMFTPYLASYSLATILALFMPVTVAFQLLLTAGYLAFVGMCIKLRQYFEVDSRLDWLFVLPFFGFAYQWGFVSFVLSAPIGLWFILLANRHAQQTNPWHAIKLFFVGFLLLESHGLMFLFAFGVGGLLLVIYSKSIKCFIRGLAPYLILALTFTVIFFINLHLNSKLGLNEYTLKSSNQNAEWWNFISKTANQLVPRLDQGLRYTLVSNESGFSLMMHLPVLILLLASPWLLGLRIHLDRLCPKLIFIATLGVFVFIPDYILGTAYVYQRFALFVIPGYAFLFAANTSHKRNSYNPGLISKVVMLLLPLACWAILGLNIYNANNFRHESEAIDTIIAKLEPNQKALALIFDYDSDANNHSNAYSNYASWYQAEKHGLVDFNFAYFAPMVVRYKPDHLSAIPDELNPYDFDWIKHRGSDYRYFFVRNPAQGEVSADLFKHAPCKPVVFAKKDRWTVYEYKGCNP